MKKVLVLAAMVGLLAGCSDNNEVGDVSLGVFTLKDIKLHSLVDPEVPGVTCHIASIEANLSFSDPSDSAISCRQTGEITPQMIAQIDKSDSGEIVFRQSKSIFFKTMKVRRIYDPQHQTLMYLSYSTKETTGSFKHSLSTVPLWGTAAYQTAPSAGVVVQQLNPSRSSFRKAGRRFFGVWPVLRAQAGQTVSTNRFWSSRMQNLKQIGLFVRTNLWIIPLALLLVWLLFRFLDPAPPRVLVMTTGGEGGSYHRFGLAMQRELAKQDLELQLRPSRGSLDNLQRLTDGSGEVQLGLIQSGTELLLEPEQRNQLIGLAALYHEPLWLFQRQGLSITRLSDLQDKRVAVGSEGSGTWAVLKGLFEQRQDGSRLDLLNNGLWRKMGSSAATDALLAGELDAAFLVLPADNRLVTRLAANPDMSLVNLAQADAFAARLHFLEALEVPTGLLNIATNMPQQDTKVLSPVAMLVGNQDFHPALTAVVLEAARKVLREGNLLDGPGRFPAGEPMGLELSKEADYYHRQGMPFLQRYLPFQVASAIDRYVVLIIPFIAIMFPLLKTMGPLYRWRVRARVYRWYEHLRRIDKLIYSGKIKQQYAEQIQGLKALESELNHVDVPLSYAHELYSLHLHVRYMIYRLETLQAEEEGGEKPSPA